MLPTYENEGPVLHTANTKKEEPAMHAANIQK